MIRVPQIRRLEALAVVLVLLGGPAVVPAFAQTEPVDLTFKAARGEILYFDFTRSVRTSVAVAATPTSTSVEETAREALRVLDVDQDGTMRVEVVFENYAISTNGAPREAFDTPVILEVRSDGAVLASTPERDIAEYPIPLPHESIAAGDSWTRQGRGESAGATFHVTETFTLVGIDQTNDGRVARIRTQVDGVLTGTNSDSGYETRLNGKIHGQGAIDWSLDRSQPLRVTEETTIDSVIEVTGQGQTVRGKLTTTVTEHREALPADSVTIPPTSEDVLITPGKGIGLVALDQPVDDVSTRLGAPTTVNGEGYHAARLSWPSGLRGYVAEDQRTLLGLQSGGDRRYRTDKGIGLGSSKGAVLLAYGMAPTEVDLRDAEGGKVHVLVYNDQGIAFGIAGEQGSTRDPEHVPAGTVAWIMVFAPGEGAKIFPLEHLAEGQPDRRAAGVAAVLRAGA